MGQLDLELKILAVSTPPPVCACQKGTVFSTQQKYTQVQCALLYNVHDVSADGEHN